MQRHAAGLQRGSNLKNTAYSAGTTASISVSELAGRIGNPISISIPAPYLP